MKKLGKLKLHKAILLNDNEMKNVVGGYDSGGTCAAYIPASDGYWPSSGSYNGDIYASGGFEVKKDTYTIFRGISKDVALAIVQGVPGAKWCCDSCSNASWY
jgi:natural product precursor